MTTKKNDSNLDELRDITLTPYIQIALPLITVPRRIGGNMFRHQMATMAILIDYKFIDSVMLKAAVIHDLLEDIPDTPFEKIINADNEGSEVLKIVLELTKHPINESKPEYLTRLHKNGSFRAKVIKLADRISNITDITTDIFDKDWIDKYIKQTEEYILPMAADINEDMHRELSDSLAKKKKLVSIIYQSKRTAKLLLGINGKKKKIN